MNRLSIVGGICASLLLGSAITAAAQDEHKNERQEPARPENRQEPARPDERRNEPPQSGNRHNTTPQSEGRQDQQPQSGDRRPQRPENERQMQQPEQQRNMERPRQEQAQPRGQHGANQRRIPQNDFRAHFGREHRFAPGRVQVVQGRPQFAYSGYVFQIVEMWPSDWAYDADDYYIDDFGDEYWLCSFSHPDVRLELIIIG